MKTLHATVSAAECAAIKAALREHNGNVSKAADALDISRRELTRKMVTHGLGEWAAGLRTKAGISGPRGDK